MIGILIRTGNCADTDQVHALLSALETNPRLLLVWGKLKAIAEPSCRMAETALGLALMAEKNWSS